MEEIWQDIIGYEGLYQVSNLGKVRNKYMHILKPRPDKNGYLRVRLFKGKTVHFCSVHRIVANAFITNPNNHIEINHKDENKTNNSVENLEWCSRQHNMECYWSKKTLLVFDSVHKLGTYYRNLSSASKDLDISTQTITNGIHSRHKSRMGYSFEWDTKNPLV